MKKFVYSLAFWAAFVLVACDEPTPQPENPKPTQPENPAEQVNPVNHYLSGALVFNEAFNEAGAAVAKVNFAANAPADSAALGVMPNVTWVCDNGDNNFPVTVTVDYGAENVLGTDGRYHRGKMVVKTTGWYTAEGTQLDVTFHDWYVDNVKVLGSQTIKNIGRNEDSVCVFNVKVEEGALVTDSMTVVYEEDTDRAWVIGEAETDILKHTYSITGGSKGEADSIKYDVKINEEKPMVVNVGTLFPLSGELEISVPYSVIDIIFPGYGELIKAMQAFVTDDDNNSFKFILEFIGDNKAVMRFEYYDLTTQQKKEITSDPVDLTLIGK